jgi:hypothetical protein
MQVLRLSLIVVCISLVSCGDDDGPAADGGADGSQPRDASGVDPDDDGGTAGKPEMCTDAKGVRCVCEKGSAGASGKCAARVSCDDKPCGNAPNMCAEASDGYSCTCGTGFMGTGSTSCTDIDECKTNNGGCAMSVFCENTVGGSKCGTCPQGLIGDGKVCTSAWTKLVGTNLEDKAQAIAADAAGNVYIAGYTAGGFSGATNAGEFDVFVAKLNADGTVWVQQIGGSGADIAYGVSVDGAGNVYVAGTTSGAIDGNTGAGSQDLFLIKYDGSGAKQWSRQYGTAGVDYAFNIVTNAAGDTYIAATLADDIDGTNNAGDSDAAVIKYDAAGARQWTRQFGTAEADIAYGIALDATGNVYVTGTTKGNLVGPNAGDTDNFVRKYDGMGMAEWTRQLGSSATDYARAAATDASGSVFVVGSSGGSFDGNSSAGSFDLVLVKYDATGTKSWSRQLGSDNYDYGQGVTTDATGAVYIAGYTTGNFDGHTSLGLADFVVVKFDGAGAKQWSRQLGGAQDDFGFDLKVASAGSLFIAGASDGDLDKSPKANPGFDAFVTKYDAAGNHL